MQQADIDKILNIIKRKVLKGHAFTSYNQRNTSGLLNQFIL